MYKDLTMQRGGVKLPRILVAGGPDLESCPHYWFLDLKLLQLCWWSLLIVYHQEEGKDVYVCVVCVCAYMIMCVYM